MDVLTALMMAAVFKKATMLEQWLVNHRHCYPGASIEFSNDNAFETGRCSCGEELELTVVIDVVPKIKAKPWQLA